MMKNLQKMGGIAALIHASVYIVGMVLGITLMFPVLDASPGQYVAFVAAHQTLVYIWNLITYWGSAITLVVMALALYHKLKPGSPALMQTATVFGLIWAALIIGSGNLMLHDTVVVAGAYVNDPAQAAMLWSALEAVETGLVSANEWVGSLWVLLLSVAVMRSGGLSRVLSYFGAAIGLAGILTMVPATVETMRMVFGSGMIVWSIWLGIVLLRSNPAKTA
jgi:Domain of unknown function (DUF4386)